MRFSTKRRKKDKMVENFQPLVQKTKFWLKCNTKLSKHLEYVMNPVVDLEFFGVRIQFVEIDVLCIFVDGKRSVFIFDVITDEYVA